MPTLVLWADSDAALGVGLLRGIDKEVPKAEVHVLKDCSHWVQQDKCAVWPASHAWPQTHAAAWSCVEETSSAARMCCHYALSKHVPSQSADA